MVVLGLSAIQRDTIQEEGRKAFPRECCGLLLGKFIAPDRLNVVHVWPTENVWTPERAADLWGEATSPGKGHDQGDRYLIEPAILLQAQRWGRDRGWEIVGIYHSHPGGSPRPSTVDRDLAWEGYVYVIVGTTAGGAGTPQAWQLNDQGEFEAVAIGDPPP